MVLIPSQATLKKLITSEAIEKLLVSILGQAECLNNPNTMQKGC